MDTTHDNKENVTLISKCDINPEHKKSFLEVKWALCLIGQEKALTDDDEVYSPGSKPKGP